jgi:twitching motility protein PilT
MSTIEALLHEMVSAGASDLFLSEGRPPAWRIDGEVSITLHAPTTRDELAAFMASTLRPAQKEAFDRDGDIDVGRAVPDLGRFRVHFLLQRGALGAVVRSVPSGQLAFDSLHLPPALAKLASLSRGLVLVAGSTGSGKSTTLAAMVHHINSTRSRHIVTLEDPIEFVHDDLLGLVTQREIGSDTRDFESGLRHVLRESPDVIVIGEMRDAATMSVALSAALTGHLVLSSLHTNDASQTLQRILAYFPEHLQGQIAMDLSMCLEGVVAQRLLPRADVEGGRIPACEVLLGTASVKKLIREQRVDELADVMGQSEGMETFTRALVRLYKRGLISMETGAAYAGSADEFRLATQGMERGVGVVADRELSIDPGEVDMRTLLEVAMRNDASDIHLIAGSPPIFRIHGLLRPLDKVEPMTPSVVRRLLFSLFSVRQREKFDLEHELDFALTVTGGHRFRVNAHYQRGAPAAAIRLIPNRIPDIESLGLPAAIRDLTMKSQGLVLVTGPTGSGKSTTLAALIDLINSFRNCHIITIEDPIEFVHQNRVATIEQREIPSDSRSFASALKYILRQDPDVILVGELRDMETIQAALTAAETGHLVFGTLHSNDAPATVDRIVDVFPAHQQPQVRVQLASELLAIIAQRLVLRADETSRVAAFEVMTATPAVRAMIRDDKVHQLQSAIETSRGEGMNTLDRSLAELVRARLVTFEEASRFCRSPAGLKVALGM